MSNGTRIVVAMSGGVDSSVAAAMLCEQGYDVIGLFMRLGAGDPHARRDTADRHQGCCSADDAADARYVAGQLGIPFYALNFRDDFDRIIDYFADEYVRGRTPNPCVVCNDYLKFGRLLDYADMAGAPMVATGHYARIADSQDGPALTRPADRKKDQTYFLFGLRREVLSRVRFPLGEMCKQQVRDEARRRGFPNADKPDSVEICFVPDRDYARVVRERRPGAFTPGDVVDEAGAVIGAHEGVAGFTIGQRRGLGIAMGSPVYVTEISAGSRTITLGPKAALLKRGLLAERVNWLCSPPTEPLRVDAKIRYAHRAARATVSPAEGGALHVRFDEPQSAVTPGQAVVFYDDQRVLGGGWIESALDAEP
jgi:tRNA-specific 2-thiouridylase